MKIKHKILNWVFSKNRMYFEDRVLYTADFHATYIKKSEVVTKPLDLEKIFEEHKHHFELLLIKDFVGYIPKNVNEPALKIFEESGELFEKWTLWQSWYINTRAMNDPVKIGFYNGMMVYLKVLNTIAKVHKKNYQPEVRNMKEEIVEPSFIEKALSGIKEFEDGIKNNKTNKESEADENVETKVNPS